MNFSGNMWLMILLKVTKNTLLEKTYWGTQIDTPFPAFLGLSNSPLKLEFS